MSESSPKSALILGGSIAIGLVALDTAPGHRHPYSLRMKSTPAMAWISVQS